MLWLLSFVLLAASLFALHRLGLFLEERGWLNYTRRSRKSRASLAIAAAFDPAARQILELQEKEEEEDGDQGDNYDPKVCSPEPGRSTD